MGHIKEPNGVDFVIKSRLLTKEEEIAISGYISAYKAKHLSKPIASKRTERTNKRKKIVT